MKSFFLSIGITAVAMLASTVYAAGTETSAATNIEDKDFAIGKMAIQNKQWNAAIDAFKKVVAKDANNADAHNYLGYAYRSSNKLDDAFKHYNTALKLNPNHVGAHEYIGVAYLKVNQPEKAKEHLAKLEKICGTKCEEYEDLSKAIAGYKPPVK